jgi:uncharacterized protein (TIGR03435 family)
VAPITIKIVAGVLLVSCATFLGQTFEVASVMPADPNGPGTMIGFPNGSAFRATGITPKNCIGVAYSVLSFQLTGGPGWIDVQR